MFIYKQELMSMDKKYKKLRKKLEKPHNNMLMKWHRELKNYGSLWKLNMMTHRKMILVFEKEQEFRHHHVL